MTNSILEIDGSLGEGGGQILRSSLTLSMMTGIPFRLYNIRHKRPKPGLQPQHLLCVKAAATISQARINGATLGSSVVEFFPGETQSGDYSFAVGTAGATPLVLQTIFFPLALSGKSESTVEITGGTHVRAAPCFDFLERTWKPHMQYFGLHATLEMPSPGFYPRGGGCLRAKIQPCAQVQPWQAEEITGNRHATVIVGSSNLPEEIGDRMLQRLEKQTRQLPHKWHVERERLSWQGHPGIVAMVEIATEPVPTLFFSLGERGKKAEMVADEVVQQVREYIKKKPLGIDAHSADQIILPLALANGPSHFPVAEITQHLLTNCQTIQMFLSRKIRVEGKLGETGSVSLE